MSISRNVSYFRVQDPQTQRKNIRKSLSTGLLQQGSEMVGMQTFSSEIILQKLRRCCRSQCDGGL